MPYIPINSNCPDAMVGAWEIQEDELFFLTRLKLYENEWVKLASINHPQKRLEWLASRLCMKEILKINHTDRVESLSATNGKPYLSTHSHCISYTHSRKYAAAIASAETPVGIDIEDLGRRRNPRTSYLFMNEAEMDAYAADPQNELFILIWSAKESLYKVIGEQGLSFRQHVGLQLENFQLQEQGVVPALVTRDEVPQQYEVYYKLQNGFLLTYTVSMVSEAVHHS